MSRALIRLSPTDLKFVEIPIGNLPPYSPDFDDSHPPEATALKDTIAAADAVLFVLPEYNRSIPGALKKPIDWASHRAQALLADGGADGQSRDHVARVLSVLPRQDPP